LLLQELLLLQKLLMLQELLLLEVLLLQELLLLELQELLLPSSQQHLHRGDTCRGLAVGRCPAGQPVNVVDDDHRAIPVAAAAACARLHAAHVVGSTSPVACSLAPAVTG
jgi:hypothetical protein